MVKTCKSGYILRKGYTRKAYTKKTGAHVSATRVPASCIRDIGNPGKGLSGTTGIGKLKEGDLSSFGYSANKTSRARHVALNAAIKKFGPLSVYRKLNAVAVYTKRTSPRKSKTFLEDRSYVGKKYGYKY